MDDLTQLPAAASRHALALLRFPDPLTDWVVVTVATLSRPLQDVEARVADLHRAVPLVGARLRDETWHPGPPPRIVDVEGEPLGHPELDRPFDLAEEPPLRLLHAPEASRLAVIGHHAAFDGLALVAILRALTAGDQPQPVASPPPGQPGSKLPLLQRAARPADRVAPTPGVWPGDSYATEQIEVTGKGITGRLAAAASIAVAAHNARAGAPLRKVGLTVAVGGPAGVGNVASYRRIDVTLDQPIEALVADALESPEEPGEQVNAPKILMAALQPLVYRFSDTILLSNLGRHEIDGVERLDFFPVARGRSAVCFASAAVQGGTTSLTVRARDLSPRQTDLLLTEACSALT